MVRASLANLTLPRAVFVSFTRLHRTGCTNVVAFALRRMTMRHRPRTAHTLLVYDTHFVHLSCLPRTAAGTKRGRARVSRTPEYRCVYVHRIACEYVCTYANALSNLLETSGGPEFPSFFPGSSWSNFLNNLCVSRLAK